MFGVQYGGQCYTTATAEDTYDKYGSGRGCSSAGTGAGWLNEVYKITRTTGKQILPAYTHDIMRILSCQYYYLPHDLFSEVHITDYALDEGIIPSFPHHRCPFKQHYRDRFGACTCDSHCSWDLCRTSVPPPDCLLGTHSTWKWDKVKNAWVALIIQGDNFNSKYLSFLTNNGYKNGR